MLQIAYWLSSYPLGNVAGLSTTYGKFNPPLSKDVIKSRVQLRTTPPKGTPVQYIVNELRAVVAESGV
jgi:hypothetical protein